MCKSELLEGVSIGVFAAGLSQLVTCADSHLEANAYHAAASVVMSGGLLGHFLSVISSVQSLIHARCYNNTITVMRVASGSHRLSLRCPQISSV